MEREQIRTFVMDELRFDGPRSALTDDLPLIEHHVVDSMGLLRLVAWLETTFDIRVDDHEVVPAHFGSIAQIAELVQSKRRQAA